MLTEKLKYAFFCFAFALAGSSHAIVVINQPVGPGANQINAYAPIGQSFTAVSSTLDSIGVQLENFNVNAPELLDDTNVTLQLFAGDGFAGALLSSKTINVSSVIGDANGANAFFSFSLGTVPLTIGQSYSFLLTDSTARYGVHLAGTDVYFGGHAYFTPLGFPDEFVPAQSDLLFNVTAVPELATPQLSATGLFFLIAFAYLRNRKGTNRSLSSFEQGENAHAFHSEM